MAKTRRQYHSIYDLTGGLKTDLSPTVIPEKYTPDCREFLFRDGVAMKARGTSFFADTENSSLVGSVMGFDQYYKTDGSEKLICFTTKHVFAYNSSTELFECITPSTVVSDCETAWTANANVGVSNPTDDKRRGSKSVKIAISDDFTTGVAAYLDFSAKDLSSYTDLYLWIKSSCATSDGDLKVRISEQTGGGTGADYEDVSIPALSAGVWTMLTIPFSGAATTRDAIVSVSLVVATDLGDQNVWLDDIRAVSTFTGDEDNFFTSEIMNNLFIFSNGVDGIYKWNMTDDCCSSLGGTSGWSCLKMLKHGERLCLFHTFEAGGRYPQRVRWSVAGDPEDWTGEGSGYADLVTVLGVDWIQSAEALGSFVVVYAERTIALMEYTASVSSPFRFFGRVNGVGLSAPRTVVNLGDEHIFLGWDGLYSYTGGRTVEPVGKEIRQVLVSSATPEYIHRSFAIFIEEHGECRFYIPSASSELPNRYYCYNIQNGSWSIGERTYTGCGYYSRKQNLTIDEMTEPIDSYTWLRFDDASLLALYPINLYGDANGKVYQDDETVMDLAGEAITCWIETKDFVSSEGYRRIRTYWCELNFEARGTSVSVRYSCDGGKTWSNAKSFTLNGDWNEYRWDIEVYSSMIRFRFESGEKGANLELRQLEIGFIPLSDR